jgi:3-keto-5-aminohexanoate cleavage enzyme
VAPRGDAGPTIIQCAITGAQDAPSKNPNLPTTAAEIADSALGAWRAGAAIVHIHARLLDGTPTSSVEQFRPIVEQIRASRADVVLNLTTGSGGGRASGADRWACTDLDPELASFDCGSLNFGDRVFENSLPFLRALAEVLLEKGIKPEIECFEPGHITTALRLREEGLLEQPLHFQFILGIPGAAPATIQQLAHMRSMLPPQATWSAAGIGAAQSSVSLFALAAGGHLRTGLEDNLYYRRGELADSNAQLVARLVRTCEEFDRPVATPDEARELLGLNAAGGREAAVDTRSASG